MNRVVFKYEMPQPGASKKVAIPEGADIIHIDVQNGKVCAWAVVDPNAPLVDRTFRTIGTGHVWKEDGHGKPLAHLGTVLTMGGGLVWHVFAEIDEEPAETKCAYGKYPGYSDVCTGVATKNRRGYALCENCYAMQVNAEVKSDKAQDEYYRLQKGR